MKQVNIKEVTKLMKEKRYIVNGDAMRRIGWYHYKGTTTISEEESKIVIRTEMPIKGVYDTLILYPNGASEVKMEFD